MKKIISILLVVAMTLVLMVSGISASASALPEVSDKTKSVVPGGEFSITFSINSTDIVQGSQATIEYDATKLEYVSSSKYNLDTLQDKGNGKLELLQAEPSASYPKYPSLCNVRFKVKSTTAVGTETKIKFTLLTVSDEQYVESDINQAVDCKITVIASATPVPATPTTVPTTPPTQKPTTKPTEVITTPTNAPVTETPSGETVNPTDEVLPTDETQTVSPSMAPIDPSDDTNGKDNTVKSDVFAFGMLIAAIVGVWVGLACGFFIWGRGKGPKKSKHYTIGGDN